MKTYCLTGILTIGATVCGAETRTIFCPYEYGGEIRKFIYDFNLDEMNLTSSSGNELYDIIGETETGIMFRAVNYFDTQSRELFNTFSFSVVSTSQGSWWTDYSVSENGNFTAKKKIWCSPNE